MTSARGRRDWEILPPTGVCMDGKYNFYRFVIALRPIRLDASERDGRNSKRASTQHTYAFSQAVVRVSSKWLIRAVATNLLCINTLYLEE